MDGLRFTEKRLMLLLLYLGTLTDLLFVGLFAYILKAGTFLIFEDGRYFDALRFILIKGALLELITDCRMVCKGTTA